MSVTRKGDNGISELVDAESKEVLGKKSCRLIMVDGVGGMLGKKKS